jgi:hypothetical protein
MSKFDWIKKFFELNRSEDYWNKLSDIIPNNFDNYFLIHWNIGIVDDFPFNEFPENNFTIEDTNKRIRILRQHNLFLNPNEDNLFRKTTGKEIANLFNVNYNWNVLDNIKDTPAIKILDEQSIDNLKSLVSNLTLDSRLNLYIEDFLRYPPHNKSKQEMSNISIDKYFELQNDFVFDYNTYLFPDSQDWCILTSEDFPMLLCVNNEISSQLALITDLELFRMEYNEEF